MSLADVVRKLSNVQVYGPPYGEFTVARILKESEGRWTPVFERVGEGFTGVGNIVDTREKLYSYLGVKSDEEAYTKLLNAEENPANLETASTWRDMYREVESLYDLPMVRYYEREARPYITSGVVVGVGQSGVMNASIHRFSPIGARRAVVRLVPRHLYQIYRSAVEKGVEVPVAVAWGVHPLVLLAAASSPSFGVFELGVAARLMGGLKVVELENGAVAPFMASVIVEGYLTRDMAEEGPFVDIVGVYDRVRLQPVVRVERIYVLREGAYVHYLLPAGLEHMLLMGFEKEARIWRAVRSVAPRVRKIRLTRGGFGWLVAVISLEKSVEGDAKNALLAAFAAHPSLKIAIAVDSDVDPEDPVAVEWAVATRLRADRGLFVVPYVRGSTLDPVALNEEGLTHKVGIDATRPLDADPSLFERARIPG
ncbi:UbiD family decarboxylase [Pyrobaculum neutrophilum]|uniref:Anhydromevalonate phosphate decarboxylase n=1 Tax=Pyrobaculum neutrophilum (strain DSM 2338 / JCM 9278 / NBRC 100436 / V24Sta) TaxID=444157 RepID=B1Y993_PYRNV|nr:UbiD family decarboxylase [Pyrobaculum neutrophilum]ACB40322.1 UbiD family decarboxylase [Pyrobaculum neutrophilum V24Sta]